MSNNGQPSGVRFLAAFNEIEAFLRRTLHKDERVTFMTLVRDYRAAYPLPAEHEHALTIFARLRNAISHSPYRNGQPIADPTLETLSEIERLRDVLLAPPAAINVLGPQTVSLVQSDDPIAVALDLVRRFNFSQLPIYRSNVYVGLLTTNAIARWLADQFSTYGSMADHESVGAAYKFAEPTEVAAHVHRDTSVTTVIDLLSTGDQGAPPADTVIFTARGQANDDPLAIAVRDDLPLLYAALRLS